MKHEMKLTYYRIWLALGGTLLAIVWWLSLSPQPSLSINVDNGDKLGHIIAYAVLMIWAIWLCPRRHWLSALALCIMGGILEILQEMTGYRTFEFADMVADSIGVLLGWILAYTPLSMGLQKLDAALAHRLCARSSSE